MLFDPNSMPEMKRKHSLHKKDKSLHRGSFDSLHKEVDMRQKPISKHKQPTIYVETKVEKRKN